MFSTILRAALQRAAISQAEAARRAGLSRQRIHQLVHGTHQPSWREAASLVAALEIDSTEVAQALVDSGHQVIA